jgi:hypothetical protein
LALSIGNIGAIYGGVLALVIHPPTAPKGALPAGRRGGNGDRRAAG